MSTTTTVGWINNSDSASSYLFDKGSATQKFHIKKILTDNELMANHYPGAEIVADKNAIMNDDSIELVIVSSPADKDLDIISDLLKAGKKVQII